MKTEDMFTVGKNSVDKIHLLIPGFLNERKG